jgi:hypothetical protein
MAGFIAAPGKNFSSGPEAEIAKRLDALAKHLGITIYGISGARTPAQSVAVGGSANDPHTQGAAADIGVNSMLRTSASQLTDDQLASVGLYRPFSGATEINHVQLLPGNVHNGGGILKTIAGLNPITAPAVIGGDIASGDIPGSGLVSGAEDAASAASSAVRVLTDPKTWIRVVEVLLGGALLLMGLKSFTGGTVDPVGAAAGVARRVA